MKKVFAILAVLSLLMVPCVSMAATMSDADLAAITGQSGVDINISGLDLALGISAISWGDFDGDQTGATVYTNAGFVNILFPTVPFHIGVGNIAMSIDVGSNTTSSKTAVILGLTITDAITVDSIVGDIVLTGSNAALLDYEYMNGLVTGTGSAVSLTNHPYQAALGTNATFSTLGQFGVSGITLSIIGTTVVTISAH